MLIVDDDPVQAAVYTKMLTRRGYTSQVTSDAKEALGAFARRAPEAILLDLGLPRGGGIELVRTVRDLPQGRAVRIFALANAYLEAESLAAWEAGADQVIGKSNYAPEQILEFLISEVGGAQPDPAPRGTAEAGQQEFVTRAKEYMRSCRDGLAHVRATGDVQHPFEELATAMRRLQAAQAFGLTAIPQLAAVTEWLARALSAWPSSLGASALRTVEQALDAIDRRLTYPRSATTEQVRYRALGVDDDATSRLLLQQAFRRVRIECDLAADGPSALTHAGQRRYDLVVTDVMMPGMDGFELVQRLHAIPDWESVPMIYVTALDGFDKAFATDPRGGCDAIVKPYLVMELATKVVVHLLEPPAPHKAP